jgi:tetratricopeptide (TPR) repeat protein
MCSKSTSRMTLSGWRVLATVVFLISGGAFPSLAQTPPAANEIARIKKVLVDGRPVDYVTQAQVTVIRTHQRTKETGERGTPLYGQDEVRTGPGVQVILVIHHPDVEKYRRIIINSNTHIRIHSDSIFQYFGRISVSIRGLFDVKTNYVSIGASGTEFECEVKEDGTTGVTVFDGKTAIRKGDFRSTVSRSGGASLPASGLTIADATSGTLVFGNPRLAAPTTALALSHKQNIREAPPVLVVTKQEELTVTREAPLPEAPTLIANDRLQPLLDWTNRAILADAPVVPAKKIIPRYDSASERAAAFKAARFRAIVGNEGRSHETLGNIFAAWGYGAMALHEYQHQQDLIPQRRNQADFLTNLSEAYRLTAQGIHTAQLNKAEQTVKRAIELNPQYAPAYNSRGNISADKANAIRTTDPSSARALLENALIDYRYASQTDSPKYAAVARANQGFTHLELGDMDKAEGQLERAAARYEQARRAFEQARVLAPDYPYGAEGLNEVTNKSASLQSRNEPKVASIRPSSEPLAPVKTPPMPTPPAFLCMSNDDLTKDAACKAFLTSAANWLADRQRLLLVRTYSVGSETNLLAASASADEVRRYVKPPDFQQVRFMIGQVLPSPNSGKDIGFTELRLVANCEYYTSSQALNAECASFLDALYNQLGHNQLSGLVAQTRPNINTDRNEMVRFIRDYLESKGFSNLDTLEIISVYENKGQPETLNAFKTTCEYPELKLNPLPPCEKMMDNLAEVMTKNPDTVLLLESFVSDKERDRLPKRKEGSEVFELEKLRISYLSEYLTKRRIASNRIKGVTSQNVRPLSRDAGKVTLSLIQK